MADEIRARVSAVKDLAHGLTTYQRGLAESVASARRDLNAAGAEFAQALVKAQTERDRARARVEMAAAELARCEENCGGLQRALGEARAALQLAERKVEVTRQAKEKVERATQDLLSSIGTIDGAAQQKIPAARAQITSYAEVLTQFLGRSVS